MLHVRIGGGDQADGVDLRQEYHEVFCLLDGDSHRRSSYMMGYLDSISLHVLTGLKTRNRRFQNRQHHFDERLARPGFAVHFVSRVGGEVISGDSQYGSLVVAFEAKGTLTGALLLSLVEIERWAQVKRVIELHREKISADLAQLVVVLHLKGAQFGILDQAGRDDLRSRKTRGKESQTDAKDSILVRH